MEFMKAIKIIELMCKEHINCLECPIGKAANKHSKDLDCTDFVNNYTEEAEKALEQWDKEQPEHTYKSALVEKFPHAFIDKVVKTTCPRTFYGDNAPSVGSCGNKCGAFKLCIKCWNQPYEEE